MKERATGRFFGDALFAAGPFTKACTRCAGAWTVFILLATVGVLDTCVSTAMADPPIDGPGARGDMVIVPGGDFEMGDSWSEGASDELPVHTVYLDSYVIDKCEVTNQQYADGLNWAWAQGGLITVTSGVVYKCNSGTSYPYCDTYSADAYSQIHWDGGTFTVTAGKADHPMVMVSWYGAVAYCNWRSAMESKPLCYDLSTWTCNFGVAGYRLPTEAEWEKAARGGTPGHRFPWSDTDTIQHARANYESYWEGGVPYWPYDTSATEGHHPCWGTGSSPYTSPVGFFTGALQYKADWGWPGSPTSYQTTNAANGYGLYDMAGNAWEWCNDWYSSSYYSSSPGSNPMGPASGTHRVLRGAFWSNTPNGCRLANRHPHTPDTRQNGGGFRCTTQLQPDINCEDLAGFGFGLVPPGECSAEHTWDVINEGTAQLIGAITLEGADAGEFEFTEGDGDFTLEPGENRTVGVRFCPTSVGAKTATLHITSNDQGEDPCDLPLSTGPEISRAPESLFPMCLVGEDAANDTFEVWNGGAGTLEYFITDDVTWLECVPSAGDSTGIDDVDTITVTYSTSELECGTHEATITISDPEASNNPQTITVELTVTGQPSIGLDTYLLIPECPEGEDAPDQIFEAWNAGRCTLDYAITVDYTPPGDNWILPIEPPGGTLGSGDDPVTHTVSYSTAGLACSPDPYLATITISDPEADNDPQTINVELAVLCCYDIGGAIYDDLGDPLGSGVADVTVTVEGENGTFTACTAGSQGIWMIECVLEGTYTVTPTMGGCEFAHVVAGVPGDPPPITIIVDAAHEAENGSIQFLADCLPGACCLSGDVCIGPVDCAACVSIGGIYQGNGTTCDDPCQYEDCNGNGILDTVDIANCSTQDCQPNGIPDECDIDPSDPDGNGQVSSDTNSNGIPDECEWILGDLDGDGDVDIDDYALFAGCMTGPEGGIDPGCELADLDVDTDVDLTDFAIFQTAFTGSGG